LSQFYVRRSRFDATKLIFGVIGLGMLMIVLTTPWLGVGNEKPRNLPSAFQGGNAWKGGGAWANEPSRTVQASRPGTVFAAGGKLTGRVTYIRDGDTIEVQGIPVRIANLDCAERDSSAGKRATQRMRALSSLGSVTCTLEGRRSYDREVGVCRLSNGRDMGEVLISETVCDRWR